MKESSKPKKKVGTDSATDSIPVGIKEIKILGVPVVPKEEKEDVIFTFEFGITNQGSKSTVNFTLQLNPSLKRLANQLVPQLSSLQGTNEVNDGNGDKKTKEVKTEKKGVPNNKNEPVKPLDPIEKPMVFLFDKNGTCDFVYTEEGGWFIKGMIKIIHFQSPNGQFNNNTKNFDFDIIFGKVDGSTHEVLGLYQLDIPNVSD